MVKKIILATMSYFVITMAISYPWFLIWFKADYELMGAVTRPEPIMPFGTAAMIIQGIVIAYLFSFYRKQVQGNPIVLGVKFSLIAGLLVATVMVLATAAKINIEPVNQFLLLTSAHQFLQFFLTGIALGFIYSRGE
ncbi:MAG: hypothetical protein HWD86_01655 [Kangiellaceae bacterium]|nr:hypothetical protein [Kangiellaceae bacterium]